MVSHQLLARAVDSAMINPAVFVLAVALLCVSLLSAVSWSVFLAGTDQLSPAGEFLLKALVTISLIFLLLIIGETIYLLV